MITSPDCIDRANAAEPSLVGAINDRCHQRQAINPSVSGAVEFFTEHIRIEFLVVQAHGASCQSRTNCHGERVFSFAHGRGGIENQPPTGTQPIEAFLNDALGEARAQMTTAVAVRATGLIGKVRRIGDDKVEGSRDRGEKVTRHRLHVGNVGEGRVDCGVAERQGIAIGEDDLLGVIGDGDSPGAAAASEVKGAVNGTGEAGNQRDKAIGIRAEKYRILVVGGEGRMDVQCGTERGKAHGAAPAIVSCRDKHAGLLRQREEVGVEDAGVEGPVPTEDVAYRASFGVFCASVNARMREGRDGDEAVSAIGQGVPQGKKRVGGAGMCGHGNAP